MKSISSSPYDLTLLYNEAAAAVRSFWYLHFNCSKQLIISKKMMVPSDLSCRNQSNGETTRSRWPRGLRRGSAAAHVLGLRVLIPPEAWMSVSCECCVLSGRGLCDDLITRPEESC